MKKWILACVLWVTALTAAAQKCEEREGKLLEAIGSFSAAQLYNTYGLIGSVTDAYMKDVYADETVNDLMNAQKKLMDNLLGVIDNLVSGHYLKDQSDVDYCQEMSRILKGLKKQAQLLLDYVKNRRSDQEDAYEKQRKANWSAISKLMGIEE